MIRGNDFILNPDKLQEEFQLVEVSDWVDFSTKEKLGFYYTVLLPKLKFEKVKVGIKANTAIVTNEELEQKGQIPVSFDGLQYSYLSICLSVLEKQKLSVGKILTTITGLYIFTDRRPVNVH